MLEKTSSLFDFLVCEASYIVLLWRRMRERLKETPIILIGGGFSLA
jgi:hypothetical protein